MAKKPTPQTEPSEPQSDVLPALDDDAEVVAASPAQDTAADDAPADRDEPAKTERYNPREEAVRRYRERRKQEEDASRDDDVSAAADAAGDDDVEEADVAPVKAAPAEPAMQQDEPEFTLLVDGKPVKMKQSEVLAKAQIAVASDNRLDEAKALLKEARALRGRDAGPEHHRDDADDDLKEHDDPSPSDASKTNQSRPAIDKEKLRTIVQRIQVGDEEEGAEALLELAQTLEAGKQQITPEDIGRVVARSQIQNELKGAAEAFQGKHAAVINDPDLRDVTFGRVRSEVREDLQKLGFDSQKLAGMTGEQLFSLHMDARAKGMKVRDYNQVFDKVGTDMTKRFGAVVAPPSSQPTKQPTADNATRIANERLDRKRATIQQPRTAGMRQAPAPQKQPKSHADVIAEMRKARGFNN